MLTIPPSFAERTRQMVTPAVRARVMDEWDARTHGDAIVTTLEKELPIKAGLRGIYEHPSTKLLVDLRERLVLLSVESPNHLFDENGRVSLVCDQYGVLVSTVLLSALSDRTSNHGVIELNDSGGGTHFGARFNVNGSTHATTGIPRWYQGRDTWEGIGNRRIAPFVWQIRYIGIYNPLIKGWKEARTFSFPYMEFNYGAGHALIGVCLICTGVKVFTKIVVCLPDNSVIHAVAEKKSECLDGRTYNAESILPEITFFQIKNGVRQNSEDLNPLIQQKIAEAVASLFSKKLDVV